MFMGGADLKLNFLRDWAISRAVSRHAFRKISVRTTHGKNGGITW